MLDSLILRRAVALPAPRDLFILLKPGVSVLLVVTAVTTALAAGGPPTAPEQVLLLALAGWLTAGGSAALNHYLDRDVDARMRRTVGRPIPAGRLAQPEVAALWGGALVAGGVSLAALTLPLEAALFILLGFLIYVPLYTGLLKRRTPWNVVIGGAAGSCPVLAGWAAVRGDWPVAPLALAAVVFFWSPAHFWAYAAVHEDDYRRARLPMLPAVIGIAATPPFIMGHAVPAVLAALLAVAGFMAGAPPIAAGLVWTAVGGASALMLGACARMWREPTAMHARALYKVSNRFLAIVFIAIAAGARFA
ncbi:MAG TPA: heme o synthase [Chloroflexota bacterium]|nr:heme o synthase [Chloroflexota bacterium]